jgi:tRNA threonylcarbamoyladenosine biosynthesis protein TsaE
MDAIFTIDQIDRVASAFFKKCQKYKVWAFHAPMGAGKTTFISALCAHLGARDALSSPTFAIVNEYSSTTAGTLYHMDWYRLKTEAEAIDAGVEDLLSSGSYCFVEWPENAPNLLGPETVHLYLEVLDAQTRRLYIPEEQA